MKRIFVSDIHMGDEKSLKPDPYYCSDKALHKYGWLGEARAENFAEFLQTCVLNVPDVEELVILGDLFDAWVCPASCDPLSGNGNIKELFEAIVNARQNKRIVDNLWQIINEKKLIYVIGNHDTQRKDIISAIIPGINHIGKEGLDIREVYKIPDQGIWAEHGHHYTLFNAEDSYDYQGSPHILPIGYFITRLMAQHSANTGLYEDPHDVLARIVLDVLGNKPELSDKLCKVDLTGIFLELVYAGFQLYAYKKISSDMTTTMNGDDHFQGLIKASEVNSLYYELDARWKNRPNPPSILLAILSDFSARHLKFQAHHLSSEKERRLIIFGHTHEADLSHYFPADYRLDNDPNFAKYRGKYPEVMEKLSQAATKAAASLTCGEDRLYANTGSWIDNVPKCTYLETEESGKTLRVTLKEYLGSGQSKNLKQFLRQSKDGPFIDQQK